MITSHKLPKLKLIGIHGHAGVGKDTLGWALYSTFNDIYLEAFADPLKEACAAAFGLSLKDFNDPEKKNVWNDSWIRTPREIAQFMGTEVFRNLVSNFVGIPDGDFWVHRLHGRLCNALVPDEQGEYQDGDTVVITDVRFQNEYEYITQNGGIIIHLKRPGFNGAVGIAGHQSEQGINLTQPEVTYELINDGTEDDMFMKAKEILSQAGITLNEVE